MNETKVKYPAPYLAHWVTGPVACCEKHKNAIVGLGNFMVTHVAVTSNEDKSLECKNCINESKDNS